MTTAGNPDSSSAATRPSSTPTSQISTPSTLWS